MQFVIEVDDFYLDYEEELLPQLKQHIIENVTGKIWAKNGEKVESTLQKEIHETVEREFKGKIDDRIKTIIETQKIGAKDHDPLIDEWMREQFKNNTGWHSPTDTIKELAGRFGKEMKQRYDTLFASQIVIKMNEQGLLKEGVMDSLLDEKKIPD